MGQHLLAGESAADQLALVTLPYRGDRPAERGPLVAAARQGRARSSDLYLDGDDFAPLSDLPLLEVAGRWAEARALDRGQTAAAPRRLGPAYPALFARLAQRQGEPGRAWALIREWLPAGPDALPGDTPFAQAAALQRVAAALAIEAGDLPLARAWLAAHDRWLAWSGAVVGHAEGRLGWAAYQRAAGAIALAREHAAAALADASDPRQPLALLAAHRTLGELATVGAQHREATSQLAAALALADDCAAPYERALTLLASADLHRTTGAYPAARATLADARTILVELAARPALARADQLAARLAVAPVPQAPAVPFGLTAREAEVLRLLAEGLTDPQIADRLFVSRHTVNAHTKALYGKLGVNTRAAAARRAADHGLA